MGYSDVDRMLAGTVVAIAQEIPMGRLGLSVPVCVRRTRHYRVTSRIADIPQILPVPPGIIMVEPDQLSRMPGQPVIDRDLDLLDARFTRIGCAPDGNEADRERFVFQGFDDDRFEADTFDTLPRF